MGEYNVAAETVLNAHEHVPQQTVWQARRCVLLCLVCVTTFFQFNLDTTFVNSFQAMPGFLKVYSADGKTIDATFQSLISSLLQLGLMFGGFSTTLFAKFFGRTQGLKLGFFFTVFAVLIQMVTTSWAAVYAGRFFVGFANGVYVSNTILYVSEISPAHLRGSMVTCYILLQGLGGLIGAIITKFTALDLSKNSYIIPLGLLYIIPGLLFIVAWFMPESPRWLTTMGRDERAIKALRRIRGPEVLEEHIQLEMAEIRETVRLEKELQEGYNWTELVRGSNLRRTCVAVGSSCCQSASGINFLVGYSVSCSRFGNMS